MIEGSLEVKLATIWTHEKQRRQSEEKVREEKIIEEKSQRKSEERRCRCVKR